MTQEKHKRIFHYFNFNLKDYKNKNFHSEKNGFIENLNYALLLNDIILNLAHFEWNLRLFWMLLFYQ